MDRPEISVLLPFRDALGTLPAALESVLLQEGPTFEVCAVDDGSTDGGAEFVAAAATRDERVRLLRSHGVGIVGALGVAARASRASLLARMDADDVNLPGRFAKQVSFLEANLDVAVVGTRVRNLADAPIGEGLERYVAWQNGLLDPEAHARDLFIESPLCHPSVMMRRAPFHAVGGYRDAPWAEDYDLWLRLSAAGERLAKLPDVLLEWRNPKGRLTTTDPRCSVDAFRRAKAHYLAPWLRASGRPLTVWGAGPNGRRLARELESHGIRAARFVDVDPKKIGSVARGVPIVAPDALVAGAETVIAAVGSRGARELIRDDLRRRGFVEGKDFRVAA